MLKKVITRIKYPVLIAGIVLCLFGVALAASGNIDATDKYAWSTNAGWINLRPEHGGVTVYSDHLEGYAWGENIGWIRLGTTGSGDPYYDNTTADNYGVNNDGSGNLSGYAWSTNAGWINFNPGHSQVTIDSATGRFDGYAWSENAGWVHFDGPYSVVAHSSVSTGTGGNWHSGSTWIAGSVPDTSAIVTISAGTTVTVDSNVQCYRLTIESGGVLVIPDGVTLTVTGELVNNGTIQQTQDVNGSSDVTFFNIGSHGGVTINANGTDLGSTVVSIRGNQDCTTVAGETVKRCFDIAPTTTSDRNATITFYFDDSELAGNTCSNLNAFRNTGGSNWSQLTLDTAYGTNGRDCSSTPRSIRVTGVSDFSPFVLKSGSGPTAITVQRFTARSAGGGNGFVLPLALVWRRSRRR